MLGPTSAGERGELLPKAVYDKIPTFGMPPSEGLDYALMRAVAIRYDACFLGKNGLDAQIRLVMQPIAANRATLDSAIRVFDRLGEDEMRGVVTTLRKLRQDLAPEQTDAPLDVSPVLRAQGVEVPCGSALTELALGKVLDL